MKPFTMYHFITESFSKSAENLVSQILQVIYPEKIYLLGASLYKRRSESIFCTVAPTAQNASDYFFLILVNNLNNRTSYEWQDQIEHHCSSITNVTTIVIEISSFNDWLKTGNIFARKVLQSSIAVYDAGRESLLSPAGYNEADEYISLESCYMAGLNKAQEFLVGADLFKIREQNKMAAFMLHQSAEQALRTMLKMGTGFHCCTHNIDRLIRYANMVSYQLPDVFPRKTENEKRLFSLLQKAYVDARYNDNYIVNFADLVLLTEKVKRILELLIDLRKKISTVSEL